MIWVAVGGRGTLRVRRSARLSSTSLKTDFTTGLLAPYWLFALGGMFILSTLFLPKGIVGPQAI